MKAAKRTLPARPSGKRNRDSADGQRSFRLYVAGESPNARRAIENFHLACESAGHPGCDLEIVDVLREPRRALDEGILVCPTLIITSNERERRIIGDLRNREAVVSLLDLPKSEA